MTKPTTPPTVPPAPQATWKKWSIRIVLAVVALVLLLIFGVIFVFRPFAFGDPPRVPQGWGRFMADEYKGTPAGAQPMTAVSLPSHPFLAHTNSSNMHVDGGASDVHPVGGILGINPVIQSYAHANFGGECASLTFDSRGNLVAVCAGLGGFALVLLSPEDLRPLTQLPLPPRQSSGSLRATVSDTSGGAYFFLDNQDRAVLVDADQILKVIGQQWEGDQPSFEIEAAYELLPTIETYSDPTDVITTVLPDWQGRYWFISRLGLIGVLDPATEEIAILRLDGEEIQNSFAVDEDGVYIVSDQALYGITTAEDSNEPVVVWREAYETSDVSKPGTITNGSGTTPTLFGDGYVAIADNANPQINIVIYQRSMEEIDDRLVCKTPVFAPGQSATENTLIGVNNSIIVENNYGYDIFPTMMFGKTGAGGVARVDILEDGECAVVWENPIIAQTSVPKLSLENGLVYVYAKDPTVGWGVDAYYLSALDFATGETVFEVLTGTGVSYDNHWAPITLASDGCAYAGLLRGLVQVCDQP